VAKYTPCSAQAAEAELKAGKRIGAVPLCFGAPGYPAALSSIPDPPPFLWALGNVSLTERPAIGLVGARNASSLGTRMASKLAAELSAQGFAVVSGLARGVDAAAHLAALDGGTIAIQAGGIDAVYPRENTRLHEDIAAKGLRLSEQPIGLQPMARHFPRRNRIISGMSRAVVVVEAAAKSGSLITAREALDQGREVLAVPGHPFDARSAGCNMLIRDGATLVRGIADIKEALARPAPAPAPQTKKPKRSGPVHQAGPAHAQILGLLGPSPLAEDQLIRDLAVDPDLITPQLMQLEMEGKITRSSGGLVALVN